MIAFYCITIIEVAGASTANSDSDDMNFELEENVAVSEDEEENINGITYRLTYVELKFPGERRMLDEGARPFPQDLSFKDRL